MRIIVTAGGTGGHIYPALAIINKFKEKEKDLEVLYIGTEDRIEKDIIPKHNINYIGIEVSGFYDDFSYRNIRTIFRFIKAIKTCKKIIKDFNPDYVIGIGGYVSGPVIYAARKLGIPCFIHEQNSISGKTNKFLQRYVNKIFISFKGSEKEYKYKKKVVFTGNPCSENAVMEKPADKKDFGLSDNKKLVLIVMGSMGSDTVNAKIKDILYLFNGKDYEVVFVTGKDFYDDYSDIKVSNNVKIFPYIDNLARLLKKTNILVSRAGASTISEIVALNIPTILIPSPYVADNHQYKNAISLVNEKAAIMLDEKDFEVNLISTIDDLINNDEVINILKENLNKFKIENSATKIYEEIVKTSRRRK
ncbi:MAG TPA: undecaprenyldiphospho-muramoylpentapeptide beta-N-acetylglucosaminyltransferase [Bacilli bacterium]|nr:undecaprenyldiphospho-muramoylpentapeptide beta-N-acetylglucosaminyltransferase [Bacilli bacterium]